MSYSKRQFVSKAFAKIGLAAYVFDLEPDQMQGAVEYLDGMMASWNAKGIRLGYPLTGDPAVASLDTASGVPDSANEAIYCNLAIRLAPDYGKTVSAELKQIARESYRALLTKSVVPQQVQLPDDLPAGAGHKGHRRGRVFLDIPDDTPATGLDNTIDGIELDL